MIVLSIPRGGVVVGDMVATTLKCAHDVVIVKKVGFPKIEELAIGAVAEDGIVVLDRPSITHWRLTKQEIDQQIADAREKVTEYVRLFRNDVVLDVRNRLVILVDDGIATGETMKAAIHWLDKQAPAHMVVAVPVIAPTTARSIAALVDEVIYLLAPTRFGAVGQFYIQFDPVEDAEVIAILRAARQRSGVSTETKLA
jgi:predicted phosphoribosyltransferase